MGYEYVNTPFSPFKKKENISRKKIYAIKTNSNNKVELLIWGYTLLFVAYSISETDMTKYKYSQDTLIGKKVSLHYSLDVL